MGHTRICNARKRYAWQLMQRNVRYTDIRDRITKKFGTQHGPAPLSPTSDRRAPPEGPKTSPQRYGCTRNAPQPALLQKAASAGTSGTDDGAA